MKRLALLLALLIIPSILCAPARAQERGIVHFLKAHSWTMAVIFGNATDIALTQYVWNTRPNAHEINPIYGSRRPDAFRMAAVDAPLLVGVNLLSFKLKASHRRLSFVPQAVCLAGSAWGISENIHTMLTLPPQSWHLPPRNRPFPPPKP
jgi:hypothetical protein